ncbi:MAG TPA: cobalamin-binding protein [Candidatus Baltobacteraceae bacterium]|nr:cobalamin-binding protein [Candidatus Baltobacteraceae bacterium]
MRIVSLLPSATEILFAIGAGYEVVGVTHECDFPSEALSLPKLTSSALPHAATSADIDRHVRRSLHAGSSLYHLDAELLEELAPDLIVTQELCAVCAVSYEIVDRAAKRLRGDHRIVSLEPSSLEDVFATIAFLGDATGRSESARDVADAMRASFSILRADTQRASRQRVLVLEWTDPPMSAGHWTPELVEYAGATPVLAHPHANSQTLAWDAVAEADPDAVIVVPCGFDLEKTRAATAELDAVPMWNALRARREGRVFLMDGNAYVNRPGPRLFDSAKIMAELLGHLPVANPRPL